MNCNQRLRLLALMSAFLCIGQVSEGADFAVTKVAYTDTHATFTLSSYIMAGETATLTIREEDASRLKQIRTSLLMTPLGTIEEKGNDVILKIKSSKAVKAKVTFVRSLSSDFEVWHTLDLSSSTLNSSLRVVEASGTGSQWINAELEASLRSGLVTADNVNLAPEQATVVPANEVKNYALEISYRNYKRPGEAESLTDPKKVYDVFSLKNNQATPIPLPKGRIAIFDGPTYLYTRSLAKGLKPGRCVDVPGLDVLQISATQADSNGKYIEALSLRDGLLEIQKWNSKVVTIKNSSKTSVDILFGSESRTPSKSNPEPQPQLTGFLEESRVEGDKKKINLLDIELGNLAPRTAEVEAIQIIEDARLERRIRPLLKKVLAHYLKIQEARDSVNGLTTALTRAKAVVNLLRTTPGTDPDLITSFEAAERRIENEKKAAEKKEPQIIIELVNDLLP